MVHGFEWESLLLVGKRGGAAGGRHALVESGQAAGRKASAGASGVVRPGGVALGPAGTACV